MLRYEQVEYDIKQKLFWPDITGYKPQQSSMVSMNGQKLVPNPLSTQQGRSHHVFMIYPNLQQIPQRFYEQPLMQRMHSHSLGLHQLPYVRQSLPLKLYRQPYMQHPYMQHPYGIQAQQIQPKSQLPSFKRPQTLQQQANPAMRFQP